MRTTISTGRRKKSNVKKSTAEKEPSTQKKQAAQKKSIRTKPSLIAPLEKKRSPESFFESVYEVVRLVPSGRATSYGAIASYLGTKLSARMVGWAMNAAHLIDPPVPAHRVVNRNGMLSGRHHFGTPTLMKELLVMEGIEVKDDTIQTFQKVFWDPAVELAL